jgi:hypothetical protein
MKKKTEVMLLTDEQKALLDSNFPVGEESNRLSLPKFGMLAKDLTEESGTGKNKKIKVLQAAGTFFTERDEGETNAEGKKVWTKTYIDSEIIDVQIIYFRHQLRMYDSSLGKFYSTPIYDNSEQVIPLYLDKAVVKKGTEKQLRDMFPKLSLKGKPSSKLDKKTILYVLYEGEMCQFELSVSSGWEFSGYRRKVNPSTVVTTLSSTQETSGSNTYNKVLFNIARPITSEEFDMVNENQTLVKTTVENDSKFLLASGDSEVKANDEFDAWGKDKK